MINALNKFSSFNFAKPYMNLRQINQQNFSLTTVHLYKSSYTRVTRVQKLLR